jgi:hypothetical protein
MQMPVQLAIGAVVEVGVVSLALVTNWMPAGLLVGFGCVVVIASCLGATTGRRATAKAARRIVATVESP